MTLDILLNILLYVNKFKLLNINIYVANKN
jgi:hypothetical protein